MANPSYLALTTMNGQILYSGRIASTAPTTVYAVPASRTCKIATGVVCNTSGLASVVTDGTTGASRTVNDGATNTNTTVSSSTAAFDTVLDVGATITGGTIPAAATVVSVTNATTVVISAAATATAAAVSLTIARVRQVTSVSANFTAVDLGKTISGGTIPALATITAVVNVTTVTISSSATATATGVSLSYLWPAAPCAVSVSLHQAGQTNDGTHRIVSGFSLPAGESLLLKDLLGGAFLGEAEFITIQPGTANVLDVVLTGAVSA